MDCDGELPKVNRCYNSKVRYNWYVTFKGVEIDVMVGHYNRFQVGCDCGLELSNMVCT